MVRGNDDVGDFLGHHQLFEGFDAVVGKGTLRLEVVDVLGELGIELVALFAVDVVIEPLAEGFHLAQDRLDHVVGGHHLGIMLLDELFGVPFGLGRVGELLQNGLGVLEHPQFGVGNLGHLLARDVFYSHFWRTRLPGGAAGRVAVHVAEQGRPGAPLEIIQRHFHDLRVLLDEPVDVRAGEVLVSHDGSPVVAV